MSYEPIQQLDVENYGCIQKASFQLSPLHALIGPNDSGKSTILRALRTAAQFAASSFYPVQYGGEPRPRFEIPFDPMLDMEAGCSSIRLHYADKRGYRIRTTDPKIPTQPPSEVGLRESVLLNNNDNPGKGAPRDWTVTGLLHKESSDLTAPLRLRLTTATMIRFDPNALRRRSKLLLSNQPIQFFDETGHGLASVYQAINSRDVDAFVSIRNRVRELFPSIQDILVPTVADHAVVLQTRLANGTVVPSAALSEGLLYFLGYAALQYLADSRLYLVEEPENGLHPARIAEVMQILREISKTSQVVIATHSPLVVNELQGHEISVVTRDPDSGTQAVLLKDVPGFEDAAKVYRPGEFWVSYADGKTEEPLRTGKPRQ